MDGVNTDTIAIEDEHEDSDHCTDDLAFCPKESQGSDEKPELEEEHLSGMAIAKELSRTAAIAGLQGPPMTSTSSEEEELSTQTSEMTSPPGEEASVIDVLALRTCVSDLLQPLVQKVDTLSCCVERERRAALFEDYGARKCRHAPDKSDRKRKRRSERPRTSSLHESP